MKYDVIVVGGGFAGIGAAISASRQGARVLLIEKSNCLGGAATNALVTPFMPNHTTINGKKVDFSGPIFREIKERLSKESAIIWDSHFLEEELKLVLNRMATENHIDLLFHANLTKSNVKDDKIKSITVSTIGGEIELFAPYFIDATGDAQLSFLSGVETILGRERDNLTQPMTLCFRVGNVDAESFFKDLDRVQAKYKENQLKGSIKNPRENILVFRTPIKNVLHFNATRVVKKNPVDPFEKSEAELIAREQIFELFNFLKENASGMDDAFIMSTGSEIGVRESRKIVGEYTLTENDCITLARFDDAIVACNYDLDIHNPEGAGTSHHYFKDGEYYEIPYRCLIPKGISNMLTVGRCISSTHEAQASYRIMPTVCSVGEAAGIAIAQALKNNQGTKDIDIKELQKALKNEYKKCTSN